MTNGLANLVTSSNLCHFTSQQPAFAGWLPPQQAQWHTCAVFPGLGNWRQEKDELEITQVQASLGYIEDPVPKREEGRKRTGEERRGEGERDGGAKIKELLLRVLVKTS